MTGNHKKNVEDVKSDDELIRSRKRDKPRQQASRKQQMPTDIVHESANI